MKKTKAILLMLLAAGTMFAQISIGVRIGPPPPERIVRVQPHSPGPGYTWLAGYWYPSGNKYKWHDGYWTRPAYSGAHWVQPRYESQQYYAGHWDGDHGKVNHNHLWDKSKGHERDYNHDHE